jgi:hypothetical protein
LPAIYAAETPPSGCLFFVPDQTLLLEEAQALGIGGSYDFFGGIVPHQFVKTKSIAHQLVGSEAHRPEGWSESFSQAISEFVLPG